MGTSIESKRYTDVVVNIHKDVESGIITSKFFYILKNSVQVRDNITVMCLKHDLQCCSHNGCLICKLRSFDDVVQMIAHIKQKANKLPYSFKLKGQFALVTIGDKKYIYRITFKNKES